MAQMSPMTGLEYEVLSAILRDQFCGPNAQMVLIAERAERAASDAERAFASLRRLFPQIEMETVEDLAAKDASETPIEARFTLPIPHAILTNAEARALSEVAKIGEFHQAVFAKYPEVERVVSVSRVGFNAARTQAVACVGWQSGPRHGSGTDYFVQESEGRWHVTGSGGGWMS